MYDSGTEQDVAAFSDRSLIGSYQPGLDSTFLPGVAAWIGWFPRAVGSNLAGLEWSAYQVPSCKCCRFSKWFPPRRFLVNHKLKLVASVVGQLDHTASSTWCPT